MSMIFACTASPSRNLLTKDLCMLYAVLCFSHFATSLAKNVANSHNLILDYLFTACWITSMYMIGNIVWNEIGIQLMRVYLKCRVENDREFFFNFTISPSSWNGYQWRAVLILIRQVDTCLENFLKFLHAEIARNMSMRHYKT